MRRLVKQICIAIQGMVLLLGTMAITAQGAQMPAGYHKSDKLPKGFTALVPPGYTLDNQQYVKYGPMATVSFAARKQFENHHSLDTSEYHLELMVKESPGMLIKQQAPMYKKQLEADTASALNSHGPDDSDPTVKYDQGKLTKYPWGTGITQKVTHRFIGAGTNPDEIEYRGVYFGVLAEGNSLRRFKLSVSGVETADIADAWAKQVAEKASKTSLGNIGD